MKEKKRYSHLFFDLDNTLWDFKSNSWYAMKSAFSRFDRHLKLTEFERFFGCYTENNRLLWDEYRKGELSKKELIIRRFQMTFDELDIKGIDPLEMNDVYLEEMPLQHRLVPGAQQVLEYLKSRGYKMFIITNGFAQVQHKKLESSGIRNYFIKIFISEEVRAPKPAPGIFEYALKSSNAHKSKSIMIGDDYDSDVLGALSYGMDAMFFEPGKTNHNGMNPEIINSRNRLYYVSALSDISEIF